MNTHTSTTRGARRLLTTLTQPPQATTGPEDGTEAHRAPQVPTPRKPIRRKRQSRARYDLPEALHPLTLPAGWSWIGEPGESPVQWTPPRQGHHQAPAVELPDHQPKTARQAATTRTEAASRQRHHHAEGGYCPKCATLTEAAALTEYARAIETRAYQAQYRQSTVTW